MLPLLHQEPDAAGRIKKKLLATGYKLLARKRVSAC
jgi:hypothetical protein